MSEERIVKSACRMCHGICGVLVHLKDGNVVKVKGDPDCPTSHGYMCPKGKASVEYLYHPERLKHPLKRIGTKGENKWQQISWDEALDTISQKLNYLKREYGPESIAMGQGTGRPYTYFNLRFANALGTPNFFAPAHICYFPRIVASGITCGELPICDFYGFGGEYPKCILVWGANISEIGASDGMCGHQLTLAHRTGAKLIVVDPRPIPLSENADIWAQVRPGTDVLLALGMLRVIVEEKLYDKEFVEKWTVGFDALESRLKDYPLATVEELTWIPVETIKEMARLYATTKPACILWGNGLDMNVNAFQNARALLILRGITGNIDVPGGDVFWVPPEGVVQTSSQDFFLAEKLSPETAQKKLGADTYPLYPFVWPHILNDAVITGKPYPIKAFLLMGTNPLATASNLPRLEEALRKIEFCVLVDLFMTPTGQFADIVLPAATWLEQDDVADIMRGWCAQVRQKATAVGECWDDKQILIELAKRMGFGDAFPWKDVPDYCNWVLKETGLTFDEFKEIGILKGEMRYRKYEQEGFSTPSGKFEIYSSVLKGMGYDPLPSYLEPPESPYSSPELADNYPLIAITGCKNLFFFHSEYRQLKSLRKMNPDPLVEINPETAKHLGIKDKDWVWIESLRGKIKQRAKLTPGMHPKVVHAQHGWWFPEKDPPHYGLKEHNANMLLPHEPNDPIFGSEPWKGFLCKVYKPVKEETMSHD